jgi:exodeoxyribonuclease VII small subunit
MAISPAPDDLSYEAAKSALDEIVAKLEDKDLPLDDMINLWEQGEALAAVCEKRLTGARERLLAAANRDGAVAESNE